MHTALYEVHFEVSHFHETDVYISQLLLHVKSVFYCDQNWLIFSMEPKDSSIFFVALRPSFQIMFHGYRKVFGPPHMKASKVLRNN